MRMSFFVLNKRTKIGFYVQRSFFQSSSLTILTGLCYIPLKKWYCKKCVRVETQRKNKQLPFLPADCDNDFFRHYSHGLNCCFHGLSDIRHISNNWSKCRRKINSQCYRKKNAKYILVKSLLAIPNISGDHMCNSNLEHSA